jgi:hypothetical protein
MSAENPETPSQATQKLFTTFIPVGDKESLAASLARLGSSTHPLSTPTPGSDQPLSAAWIQAVKDNDGCSSEFAGVDWLDLAVWIWHGYVTT